MPTRAARWLYDSSLGRFAIDGAQRNAHTFTHARHWLDDLHTSRYLAQMSKHRKSREDADEMAREYDRVKHMEMIQAVVARLASEAALIRGWALTVSAAFFGFSAQSFSWRVAAVGLMPVLAFWGLNSYYLRSERQYRALYERVRKGETNDPYLMNANNEKVDSWLRTNFSVTLLPFYGVILLVGVLIMVAGIFKLASAESPQGHTYFLN